MAESTPSPESPALLPVGALAELYLGNLLYALERCALSLDDEGKPADAAFYRGIGRQLADARGRATPPG
ncbi:MAG: hypothetical protein MUF00_11830 [Gemmatimonadaceae bacterium]|nr:hypothetical protein [Gemmatimonadaceae bacterium]